MKKLGCLFLAVLMSPSLPLQSGAAQFSPSSKYFLALVPTSDLCVFL